VLPKVITVNEIGGLQRRKLIRKEHKETKIFDRGQEIDYKDQERIF
jgi:hypothetical protein